MVKSLIDKDSVEAAVVCLTKGIPFCLFAYPQKEAHFFSNPSGSTLNRLDKPRKFIIGFWNTKISDSISIQEELDAKNTLSLAKLPKGNLMSEEPWGESTQKEDYLDEIAKVIAIMKEQGLEKVVISRALSKKEDINYSEWIKIAEKIFEAYPETFRFMFWTQTTGAWLGASPEMLIDYEPDKRTVSTVALAGTRHMVYSPLNDDWGRKDTQEQKIVSGYLEKTLSDLNLDIKCYPTETVMAGPLQHISTRIVGTAPGEKLPPLETILDNIQPTPALSGYPKEKAIGVIELMERHPRRCYGGYVGVEDGGNFKAYVNIRSLNFDEKSYCRYAGGGILPESDPESEWKETEGKLSVLSNYID